MSQRDRTIALAGMFQAAYMVRQIARTGIVDLEFYTPSIESILRIDAANTEEVYGGIANVRLGLEVTSTLFEREHKQRDLEIARYVLGVIHLEKKLRTDDHLMSKLVAGIERAKAQSETFSTTHENVIASLADVYAETVSTLQPRIVVSGEQGYLTNPGNANKVRSLLLATMRSAVLWKQKGGARWHLIFSRGKLLQNAKQALSEL